MVSPMFISKTFYVALASCAIVFFTYVTLLQANDSISRLQAAYAAVIVLLGAVPSLVALINESERALIPLMPLHGIFYSATFGLPALSTKTSWLSVDAEIISEALELTIFGLLCLYIGYYSFKKYAARIRPIAVRSTSTFQQVTVGWLFFGGFLAFQFAPVLRTLPSVGQLSVPVGYLSLGILTLLALSGKLSRVSVLLLIMAIGLTLLLTTLSGSLASAVFFLVFIGIIIWNKTRRFPTYVAVSILLIAILLNPVKMIYRDFVWYGNNSSASVYEKAILLVEVVQEYYSDSDILEVLDQDTTTINRLSHISTLAYVVDLTPKLVPYWRGDSYRTLWTSFIPRALWPEKPEATIGQDFGHRYFLISESNLFTSINLPWLVEFYANYGVLGVFGGMFFVGVLFRLLVQKLKVSADFPIEHSLAVTVVFGLFYAESNFALMVGGILSSFVALYILLYFLTLSRLRGSRNVPPG